jgi:exonuclease III
MLDHLLISRPLLASFRSAEVHNEMLTDELAAYYADRKDPDSFHAPVVATFALS